MKFPEVVAELVQNALDQAEAGCRAIEVEVFPDRVRVTDDGPGLPVHAHPQSGRSLLEVIMTGPRRAEKNTLARLNANCLWLDVEVHKDGALWFQRYAFAVPEEPPRERGHAVRPSGTTITCAPASGAPPEFDALAEQLREQLARGGAAVKLRLVDRRAEPARDETIQGL